MTRPLGLYTRFARTADRHPHRVALEAAGQSLTYSELAGRVERVVERIEAVADAGAVGLLAGRTAAAYVGYLAALRSGRTVVPMSAATPAARNRTVGLAAGAGWVLTEADTADADVDVDVRSLDEVFPSNGADQRPPTQVSRSEEVPTYVLFTSGSTGEPKGIPIFDRHLTEYLDWAVRSCRSGPDTRFAQTFAMTFDPSVLATFVPWTSGGTVVVPQERELMFPSRFVAEHGVTHWFSVPSVISLASRLDALGDATMPDLEVSLFAGEQLTLEQAALWRRAAPATSIENLYGPTEVTVTCCGYRLSNEPDAWPTTTNGTVPIGLGHPHLETRLIDGATVAVHEGELVVRGSQRFDGYLDPARDAGAFVAIEDGDVVALPAGSAPGPEHWYRTGDRVAAQDGELVHLGRVDDQVKVAGHRVELGDVEHAVRRTPGVAEAAVVLDASVPGGQLVGFYACHPETEVSARELRTVLAGLLPGYMLPRLVPCESLPLNANGKTDRHGLLEGLARSASA